MGAMAVTSSPRLGVTRWSAGSDPFTRAQMDASHAALDDLTAIDTQGDTVTARPAAGVRGRLFTAADTGRTWRDDGTTWVLLGGLPDPTAAAPGDALMVDPNRAGGLSWGDPSPDTVNYNQGAYGRMNLDMPLCVTSAGPGVFYARSGRAIYAGPARVLYWATSGGPFTVGREYVFFTMPPGMRPTETVTGTFTTAAWKDPAGKTGAGTVRWAFHPDGRVTTTLVSVAGLTGSTFRPAVSDGPAPPTYFVEARTIDNPYYTLP